MKKELTDKQIDEIIEAVLEEMEFTVELNGFRDYDVIPQWSNKGRDAIRKSLNKYQKK